MPDGSTFLTNWERKKYGIRFFADPPLVYEPPPAEFCEQCGARLSRYRDAGETRCWQHQEHA